MHSSQRAYNIILLHPEPVPQSQHMTTAYMCQRYNKKGNPEGTKHQSHVDYALGQGDMRSATSAICTQHIIHFEGIPRAREEQRDPSTGYAAFLSVADAR